MKKGSVATDIKALIESIKKQALRKKQEGLDVQE